MHELSVAQNIVELASAEAEKKKAIRVTWVCLEIGELAGIETEALQFVWPVATNNTLLDHSRLTISAVRGKAYCNKCRRAFSLKDLYDLCPWCNGYEKDILQGKELNIKTIEIELKI